MSWKDKDLGPVDAYAFAVENGYFSGTREQWYAMISEATQNASDAEAYAKGTRAGEAVASDDPAYHNNSSYWNDQAGDNAENAEAWANGTRDGVDVTSDDPAYEKNSKYWEGQAALQKAAAQAAAETASAAYNVNLLAPNYDATSTYAVGAHVIYSGGYYECISAITTAEAWTAAHWRQLTVGGEAGDLKSALGKSTGNGIIQITGANQFIDLSGTETDPTNPSASTSGFSYTLVPCSQGDAFTINAQGGSSARAWGFLGAVTEGTKRTVLGIKAGANETTSDLVVIAPKNAEYLVINDKSGSVSYYGDFIKNRMTDTNSAFEKYTLQGSNILSGWANKNYGNTSSNKVISLFISKNDLEKYYKVKAPDGYSIGLSADYFYTWNGEIWTTYSVGYFQEIELITKDFSGKTTIGLSIVANDGSDIATSVGASAVFYEGIPEINKKDIAALNGNINSIRDMLNLSKYDSEFVKAQLDWEAGGLNNNSGKNEPNQGSRLRTKRLCYTDRDIYVCRGDYLSSYGICYKVFYWSDGDYSHNKTNDSGWIYIPNEHRIPAGSYFRIVVMGDNLSAEITDIYSSLVFKSFDISNDKGRYLNNQYYNINHSIAELNEDMQTFVQSAKMSYPENAKTAFSQIKTPLSILHFSDIHGKTTLWKRIMEYADANENYLDLIIHTGDYCDADQTAYTDLYSIKTPNNLIVYNCVGNHDVYAIMGQGINEDKSVAYGMLFNHTSDWGVTFEDDIDYSMTYYKDFASNNIRLIVLDNYYDTAKQVSWLQTVLADAKENGLHVITAAHQVTARPSQKISCPFQTLIPYDTKASIGAVANTVFDEPIQQFKQSGGKHIVHLAGHEHQDWFFKTGRGILNMAVQCATNYQGWTENKRVNGTKSMDCFNIVSADTDLGILKVIRIGANTDSYNRKLDVLTYDYLNDRLV